MSSSSSAPLRDRPAPVVGDWGSSLPELSGVTTAAMDPARIEEAMREGYATGHAAGMADGYAAGLTRGEAAGLAGLEQDRRQLRSAMLELADELRRFEAVEAEVRARFEAEVLATAFAIAEAVIDREVRTADDPGRDAIARALTVAPSSAASATVRLHPDDAARLGNIDDLAPDVELGIVPDPAVEAGGCVLVTGDTTIDASVSAALARVREVLR